MKKKAMKKKAMKKKAMKKKAMEKEAIKKKPIEKEAIKQGQPKEKTTETNPPEQDENNNKPIIKQGEKVAEIKTTKENATLARLPVGTYVIKQTKEGIIEQGYIRIEDQIIEIKDQKETQKTILEQDHTKIAVSLLDKETKEDIIGGTLVITDKEGKEKTESWITTKEAKQIQRLPVGEYYLEQKAAPTLKGYVKTEKISFKIEEKAEIQPVEMLQDYTQIQVKPKDEETGEDITDIELVIKDDKGEIVGTITIGKDENPDEIISKLPVGEYTIESTKEPYGYKPIQTTIEVKDKQGVQIFDNIKLEREEFDLKVEQWVKKIERNSKIEYENKQDEQEMKKVDIKDKKIQTEQIKIT